MTDNLLGFAQEMGNEIYREIAGCCNSHESALEASKRVVDYYQSLQEAYDELLEALRECLNYESSDAGYVLTCEAIEKAEKALEQAKNLTRKQDDE